MEPFLVAGVWHSADTWFDVKNAFDDSDLARVSQAGAADVEAAIDGAWRAAATMRRLPRHERARILRETADSIGTQRDVWAQRITNESGKPIRAAVAEVDRAIITLETAAVEALRFGTESVPMDVAPGSRGDFGLAVRVPVGVVAAITPFNSPLNLVAHKVAPAIASGNSVVLKPALRTPLTALALARELLAAGLPSEALSVITCSDTDASPLIEDDRIGALSFTGSQVGWALKARAGRKLVTLEMGGNGGLVVHHDADLDRAANAAVRSAFGSSGQRCIAARRLLVHESVAEAFIDRLLEVTGSLTVGDPNDPKTTVGPLIEEAAAVRAEQWVTEAISAGAKLATGGTRRGKLYAPTVLVDVPTDARVWSEELFAPVTSIRRYTHLNAAVDLMNDSSYGLQVGVFTQSMGVALRAFEDLEFGGVLVNEECGFRAEHMPYGGMKASGFGREGLRYAMEGMTVVKMLVVNAGTA